MRTFNSEHPKTHRGLYGFHLFFFLIAGCFLITLYLTPYLIAHWGVWKLSGDTATILSGLCRELYAACQIICHQLPERSFLVCGVPMPVCVRCLGLTIGTFLAAGVGFAILPRGDLLEKLRHYFFLPNRTNPWILVAVLLMFAVPMILDGFSQIIFPYTSHELTRFATGLIFGYFRGCIILSILSLLVRVGLPESLTYS